MIRRPNPDNRDLGTMARRSVIDFSNNKHSLILSPVFCIHEKFYQKLSHMDNGLYETQLQSDGALDLDEDDDEEFINVDDSLPLPVVKPSGNRAAKKARILRRSVKFSFFKIIFVRALILSFLSVR